MKEGFKKIVFAAIFYGLSVTISELTIGNPNFPVTIWCFTTIPGWVWSLPVHTVGFLWLFAVNRWFEGKHIFVPVTLSTLFFFLAESANWFWFHFFQYGPRPFDSVISFWIVIALYAILCTFCSLLLRRPV